MIFGNEIEIIKSIRKISKKRKGNADENSRYY